MKVIKRWIGLVIVVVMISIMNVPVKAEQIEPQIVVSSNQQTQDDLQKKRIDIDALKDWEISFNTAFDEKTINQNSIYVKSGTEVVAGVKLVMNKEKTSVTVKAPSQGYALGGTYFLHIESTIKSQSGIAIKNPVIMEFQIKSKESQQDTLYNAIHNALLNAEPEINVGRFTTNSKEAFAVMNEVLKEHPEIFYFSHQGTLFWSNGRLELAYKFTKSQIIAMNNELKQMSSNIISENIRPGMTEYEKVKAIHDYIVLNTAYDYQNYLNGTIPDSSYNIYGLLIKGTAVCEGYADTMIYLLKQIGIEAIYVSGKGNGGNHAWNKVKINNKWYNVDATWDDPVPNKEGNVRYNYFLIPDNVLAKDHSWNNAALPIATDTTYLYMGDMWSYSLNNGYYYYSSNSDDIKLYKIKIDGTQKQKIADVRANELVVYNDWIYFSNYSNGGYLFKIKIDGTALTKLNEFHIQNLQLQQGTLYFVNKVGKAFSYTIKDV